MMNSLLIPEEPAIPQAAGDAAFEFGNRMDSQESGRKTGRSRK
jgi:hypothetical protein